jgi:DNA-binding HxlR family transcriptional regulator
VLGKDYKGQDCALARTLEVIGERWTLLIVRDAFYGVRRFNDFHAHLDIPRAVLSERLNGLVEDGILERLSDAGHAGRHLYQLTDAGQALWPVLHAMLMWGDRNRQTNALLFKHAACDAALDRNGACPSCGIAPAPQDIRTEPLRRTKRNDAVAMALRLPHRLLEPLQVSDEGG